MIGCLMVIALIGGMAGIIFLLFNFVFFPDVPEGPQFDCDDKTLYMYHHFKRLGFEVKPIAGNLELENEKYEDCNHVWLLVKMGETWTAYDWGEPQFDDQHYFGHLITYEILIEAVKADID